MAEGVVELTDVTFEDFVTKNKHAVVDFWAEWCGPCKRMGLVFAETAQKMKGKVAFGKMNIDKEQKVARQYGVQSIPTFLVFKDGEHVDTIVGALSAADFQKTLSK